MAVLVLVLAVLTVSFASSLKAYLQQRHDIDALKTEIAQRQASITQLEAAKRRWKDPAYLAEQARIDFGYVMPGQTSFVALGPNGKPIAPAGTLTKASSVGVTPQPKAWWSTVWNSVELAGDPPKAKTAPTPATKITPAQTHKHKHR